MGLECNKEKIIKRTVSSTVKSVFREMVAKKFVSIITTVFVKRFPRVLFHMFNSFLDLAVNTIQMEFMDLRTVKQVLHIHHAKGNTCCISFQDKQLYA